MEMDAPLHSDEDETCVYQCEACGYDEPPD